MKTTPTTQRYIDLPAIGKKVPLGAYVAAIKAAKANPTKTFKTGLTCWWPCSGAEIVDPHGQVFARTGDTITITAEADPSRPGSPLYRDGAFVACP